MQQRVLITAGAGSIGLAIARAFTATGARVHLADIDATAIATATAGCAQLTGSLADISEPQQVEQLFVDVERELGGLDVLINNAGIAGPRAPIDRLSPAEWTTVVNLNLYGTFLVTRAAVPLLKRSTQASVLVMSSIAGRYGAPNRIAYATTKWGLVGFTRTLAMELGPYGITANTIHPGTVATARLSSAVADRAAANGCSVQEETAQALRHQSVKRFVEPTDIGALAVFLAGPHARSISGQMLPVDGDAAAVP